MKHASSLAVVVWVALLTGVLAWPALSPSDDSGDGLVRNTVRLALAYYAIAAGLMILLNRYEWAALDRGRLARLCWTIGWVTYAIHVAMAMHFYHHWSHADAIRHTEEVSGFGPGIYISHLFTLLWASDVAWWWARPDTYASRPAWIGRVLHGFMAFIIFNGMVVYETGPIRWAGIVMFAALGALWLYSKKQVAYQ